MTEDELIAKHIEVDPWRGPPDAWVIGNGVQIWGLVGALPAVDHDLARLADSFDLPLEAVEAAMAYYRRHKAVVDAKILLNEAAFGS